MILKNLAFGSISSLSESNRKTFFLPKHTINNIEMSANATYF